MLSVTKQLLIRYFNDQCSEEENEAVQSFIAAETDRELVETSMQEVFEMQSPDQMLSLTATDYSYAWQRFRQKSDWESAALSPVKKIYRFHWLRYPAAAILVAAISILGWQTIARKGKDQATPDTFAKTIPQRIQAVKGATKQVVLTDGSTVHLFPGSELLVPEDFNQNDRSIQLDGRAFFDIAKNSNKPFVVQTGSLSTRVLGTSFEINGIDSKQVAVTVRTGMVGIQSNRNVLARLTSNQQLLYQTSSGTYTINAADAAGLCSWITGELIFDNTPLPEVCQMLEQWYGVVIQINPDQWRNKKISVKFKLQPLATVLQILSLTSDFHYKIEDKNIKIY